jgi:hypothetical protein
MAMGVQVDGTAPSSSFFSSSAGRAQVGEASFKPQHCREGEGGGITATGEHSVQGSRALKATSQPRANQVTAHQPTDQETNKPTDQMAGEAAKEVSDPPTNQADNQSTDQATNCPRHLADLNEHQRRAASHSTTSPLLILAGAGSGKTKTMMARIVHFIRSGVAPHQVSCPKTLHPTPYTLHPIPYTLHPTPYTLYPTPYTLHPRLTHMLSDS